MSSTLSKIILVNHAFEGITFQKVLLLVFCLIAQVAAVASGRNLPQGCKSEQHSSFQQCYSLSFV